MRLQPLFCALAFTAMAAPAWAADREAGSTGQCKDGTYTHSESKRGACSDHGGVKSWYEKSGTAMDRSERETMPSARDEMSNRRSEREAKSEARDEPMRHEHMAGGHGKVWVNSATNVYHCEGDRWYGKTKHGEYMSEADAREHGNHADHGKACG